MHTAGCVAQAVGCQRRQCAAGSESGIHTMMQGELVQVDNELKDRNCRFLVLLGVRGGHVH